MIVFRPTRRFLCNFACDLKKDFFVAFPLAWQVVCPPVVCTRCYVTIYGWEFLATGTDFFYRNFTFCDSTIGINHKRVSRRDFWLPQFTVFIVIWIWMLTIQINDIYSWIAIVTSDAIYAIYVLVAIRPQWRSVSDRYKIFSI